MANKNLGCHMRKGSLEETGKGKEEANEASIDSSSRSNNALNNPGASARQRFRENSRQKMHNDRMGKAVDAMRDFLDDGNINKVKARLEELNIKEDVIKL